MKTLYYVGVGVILVTFFSDHLGHGWYSPNAATMRALWTPVDVGCAVISGALGLVLVGTIGRFLRRRARAQGSAQPGLRENASALGVCASVLLWCGVGLVLLTFFVDCFRHGWYPSLKQVSSGSSGQPAVVEAVRCSPVDIGCYLIIFYLLSVLARAAMGLLGRRVRPQEQ